MKQPRQQTLPFVGKTREFVLSAVARTLTLPDVQSCSITSKGIDITRLVDDGEIVYPEGTNDLDFEHLLARLPIETIDFKTDEHGTTTLHRATQKMLSMKVIPRWLITPSWGLLAAWLDVEKTQVAPLMIYGLRLGIATAGTTNERVIVLGSENGLEFLSDVTMAIAIDMGV